MTEEIIKELQKENEKLRNENELLRIAKKNLLNNLYNSTEMIYILNNELKSIIKRLFHYISNLIVDAEIDFDTYITSNFTHEEQITLKWVLDNDK